MSSQSSPRRQESLQHAAEHEKPAKRNPVLFYLMILFAAAFVLLLMSFMMQHRSNQEALDHLEETSNSAVESLENKLKENEELKEKVTQLEEEQTQLTQQAQAQAEQAQAREEELTGYLEALSDLNTLRGLYNQGRYSDARDFLSQLERNADGTYGTEEQLAAYEQNCGDPDQLEIYSPLDAWKQLTEWLG